MTTADQFSLTLRQHGQSITAGRRIVFDALRGQEPQTMQQVVTRSAGVDRASVYRTIALFERIGIVQRLQTGWKYRLELSDSFHEHHHHATCIECGCTISLHEDAKLEQFLAELAQKYHFKLSAHQLELQGLCQNCQK